MEALFCERTREIEKEKKLLEKKLGIKISVRGRRVELEGEPFDEYEARRVIEAIDFGYPIEVALTLKDEDVIFERISIKNFTRRVNLEVIKGRLIGTRGGTRKTIENLADCSMRIKGNEVGILGKAAEVEYVLTAVTNLIRGSKQANVYKFLEMINTRKKEK